MEIWFFLSLAAAAIWGATGIIDKLAVSKWIKEPRAYILFFGIFDLLMVIALFAFFQTFTPLPFAFAAGITSAAGTVLYTFALKKDEVSRVVPLAYSSPFFVAIIAAIFLAEKLTDFNYLGLALIVLGAVFLTIHKIKGHLKVLHGALLILLASFIFALSIILLKFSGENWIATFAWFYLGTSLTYIATSTYHAKHLFKVLKKAGPKIIGAITFVQAIAVFAYLLYIVAIAQGPASLVSALNTTAPAFTLFYAFLLVKWHKNILDDHFSRGEIFLKVISVASIILGIYLVS